ncbi:unnamed protein product [Peronospora effusa]|nr:unnamed protein product [Peronospora effusa]
MWTWNRPDRFNRDPIITIQMIWGWKSKKETSKSAGTVPNGGLVTQRIQMYAIVDLKEFTGRDKDEDRARSWVNKARSTFLRDQAPDDEKCLVFGDLLTGPARNWYSKLSRSTRGS